MKVIKSNILCKDVKTDSPTKKIGNFVIPDDQRGYIEAEVVSIGDEVKEINVGDSIYIYPNSGKKVNVNGEDFRVINISEVIVVL